MNNKLERAFQQLVPFIVAGIAIAVVIGLFIVFSYVLIWGILIGVIIWLITLVSHYFFPAKKLDHTEKGRVIDQDKD